MGGGRLAGAGAGVGGGGFCSPHTIDRLTGGGTSVDLWRTRPDVPRL